jgi:hypothetical protein
MNKTKMGLAAVALIGLIALAFAAGFRQGQLATVQQPIRTSDIVQVTITRDGKVVYSYTTHNLITNIGAKFVRNILGFGNQTATIVKYVALSSDTTPSVTWTKLPNEFTTGGLARASGTVSVVNATAFQVVASWTSSTTATISCTGLHWDGTAGSDGNLFAAAAIPSASVIPGDNIQVTWTVNTPAG